MLTILYVQFILIYYSYNSVTCIDLYIWQKDLILYTIIKFGCPIQMKSGGINVRIFMWCWWNNCIELWFFFLLSSSFQQRSCVVVPVKYSLSNNSRYGLFYSYIHEMWVISPTWFHMIYMNSCVSVCEMIERSWVVTVMLLHKFTETNFVSSRVQPILFSFIH